MATAIVIPARYGSTRLPGKPLIEVAGISLLERTWRIARAVKGVGRVVVATDDERIVDHARSFGAEAVMTPLSCGNGTERTHAALELAGIEEPTVINFQGDAILTPPWILEAMVEEMTNGAGFDIVTPAVPLTSEMAADFRAHKALAPSSGTTVTFDLSRNALYFSKQIIPFVRKEGFAALHRHIGLYGYTRESLSRYISLPPSPLEQTEGLEQLRALENGMKVRVVLVDYRGRTHASVDTPEDIALVERLISEEGELVGAEVGA
ncbi:3-deoxy-manno-octulosonate cytidylyltransferase [Consotaella salsifontis]|uniref:3-deoxy-manno-octulosonate cytidylyltransferase (CMP-KDO synthetase) n=1 Tax=Consotaella salsifontis TaxID=1365950 RepID=A0A1T4T352_9HYPH|nr:3-deoxy-manno-octulosonate cytidylyltransferase [Consotaella salsifontis]SKA34588.1 3-deoxy-manno-octulosonate cytidylyltransferase (CMP-KDO synthetase) [Consotaella salsifontis]